MSIFKANKAKKGIRTLAIIMVASLSVTVLSPANISEAGTAPAKDVSISRSVYVQPDIKAAKKTEPLSKYWTANSKPAKSLKAI